MHYNNYLSADKTNSKPCQHRKQGKVSGLYKKVFFFPFCSKRLTSVFYHLLLLVMKTECSTYSFSSWLFHSSTHTFSPNSLFHCFSLPSVHSFLKQDWTRLPCTPSLRRILSIMFFKTFTTVANLFLILNTLCKQGCL